LTTFDHDKLQLKADENLHIRSVLADSKGRIWIGNNGIGVLLMKLDKTTHFQSETDLFKKTAVKWKSIANRDNGTRFLQLKRIKKETFGLEIEIQEPGNMMAKCN
jgi:hypothetical protein